MFKLNLFCFSIMALSLSACASWGPKYSHTGRTNLVVNTNAADALLAEDDVYLRITEVKANCDTVDMGWLQMGIKESKKVSLPEGKRYMVLVSSVQKGILSNDMSERNYWLYIVMGKSDVYEVDFESEDDGHLFTSWVRKGSGAKRTRFYSNPETLCTRKAAKKV